MIATLRQRNFALLWFGGLIALVGDWVLITAGLMQSHENTSRSWRDDTLPDMIAVIGRIILK